ncbi:AGAP003361-PA, partial [Anopheles gambiae str. PEST]
MENLMQDDDAVQQDLCEETFQQLNRTKSNEVTPQQREAFVKLLANFVRQRDTDKKLSEDQLFNMFKNKETNTVNMGKFLAELRTIGIRRTDPRIQELMDNLKRVHKLNNYEHGSPHTQHLNEETFKAVIAPNIVLIARAFRHQF